MVYRHSFKARLEGGSIRVVNIVGLPEDIKVMYSYPNKALYVEVKRCGTIIGGWRKVSHLTKNDLPSITRTINKGMRYRDLSLLPASKEFYSLTDK